MREIARLTGTVAGTMNKELGRLHTAGLLEKHQVGNQLQFCANTQHPVFPELSALLKKTVGLADVLKLAMVPIAGRIVVAFVFGSMARSTDTASSDIDILIIGKVGFSEVVALLYDAQSTLQRDINPKIFSIEEWKAKCEAKSSFVLDVLSKPKLFLMGAQCDLDQLAESGQDRSA